MNRSGLLPSSNFPSSGRHSGGWKGSEDKRGNWGNPVDVSPLPLVIRRVKEVVPQHENRSQNIRPCGSFPYKLWKWLPWTESPFSSISHPQVGFKKNKAILQRRQAWGGRGTGYKDTHHSNTETTDFGACPSKSSALGILIAPVPKSQLGNMDFRPHQLPIPQ